MKAAVVTGPGQKPEYADFPKPNARPGEERIAVRAAALTQLTKGRASGMHYSADSIFPAVVGVDGVGLTEDGRRVYFVMPDAPNGAMAEATVVSSKFCIDVPPGIDDVTAAAIANPGMSSCAALMERAHLQPGESILINGATGVAGRLAVQVAKYLGAGTVIATGRNAQALEELHGFGADVIIPFDLEPSNTRGSRLLEDDLKREFASGIDVVVDYLWGKSAETIIVAIAKAVEGGKPVRFVHVGGASGGDIQLPGAALRSSAIVLMGSGLKSVPMPELLASISNVFDAYTKGGLTIRTTQVPLSQVTEMWDAPERSRLVFVPS